MSQNRALPSFWAALLSLMNRWMSGGLGTGRVLSEARATPPPPLPPCAPAGCCSPPTASAARLAPARTAISNLILRAGRGLNFRACTKRPLWSFTPRVPPRPRWLACAGGAADPAGPRREGAWEVVGRLVHRTLGGGDRRKRQLHDGGRAQGPAVLGWEGEVRGEPLEAARQDG